MDYVCCTLHTIWVTYRFSKNAHNLSRIANRQKQYNRECWSHEHLWRQL